MRNLQNLGPSIGTMGGVLFLMLFLPSFVRSEGLQQVRINFYGVPVPGAVVALGLMIFVGGWAYVGAIRKYKKLQMIPLSPKPTWLFFASLEALLVGLLWKAGSPRLIPYFNAKATVFVILYLLINWIALLSPLGVALMTRSQLREWWSAERDAFATLKRTEIRQAVLTYVITVGTSLAGLGMLWWSYFAQMMEYHPYHVVCAQFTFGHFVLIALAFLVTMAAMAGFIQFFAMHGSNGAVGTGVTLWMIFLIVMGVAGGVLGEKSIPALINPLMLTVVALNDVNGLAIAWKGLLIEILFAAFFIGLAYWKWRRMRSRMQSQEESQPAAA